jgi:hypothetical protein
VWDCGRRRRGGGGGRRPYWGKSTSGGRKRDDVGVETPPGELNHSRRRSASSYVRHSKFLAQDPDVAS